MAVAGVNRPMSRMRKIETKEALFRVRKRILKYLVLSFMKQEGCPNTAEAFVEEAGLTGEYEVCDNIDLDIILQDYCSYYLMRFNKQPQFCRKVELRSAPQRRPALKKTRVVEEPLQTLDQALPAAVTVTRLVNDLEEADQTPSLSPFDSKPLSGFLSRLSQEKKPIAEMLYQEIIRPSGVSWDDVQGLEDAKSLLMESVVYPIKYPQMFTGLLSPWRGVLLHGPPGAGKTLLARALAGEGGCTFFNVACSTVVDKWRGESEKIVKVLFEMASYYAPSIIFIDEVETLASRRSSPGEHEASRRLKTQLLTELDGAAGRGGALLLANSNMPWYYIMKNNQCPISPRHMLREIDPAMLRRLEKRIHVPLPDLNTRVSLFKSFLTTKNIELGPEIDFRELAEKTEGYSGSDIKLVCKEALMANVRRILPNMGKSNHKDRKDRLELADIMKAISKTKPVSKNCALRHEQWQAEMGCS